jgi:hypothetical protein
MTTTINQRQSFWRFSSSRIWSWRCRVASSSGWGLLPSFAPHCSSSSAGTGAVRLSSAATFTASGRSLSPSIRW